MFTNIKLGVIAAVGVILAGMGIWIYVQTARIDSLKSELRLKEGEIQQLETSIKKQNMAIQEMFLKAERDKEYYNQFSKQFTAQQNKLRELTRKAPPGHEEMNRWFSGLRSR